MKDTEQLEDEFPELPATYFEQLRNIHRQDEAYARQFAPPPHEDHK